MAVPDHPVAVTVHGDGRRWVHGVPRHSFVVVSQVEQHQVLFVLALMLVVALFFRGCFYIPVL